VSSKKQAIFAEQFCIADPAMVGLPTSQTITFWRTNLLRYVAEEAKNSLAFDETNSLN
jgi:hypothetical protein